MYVLKILRISKRFSCPSAAGSCLAEFKVGGAPGGACKAASPLDPAAQVASVLSSWAAFTEGSREVEESLLHLSMEADPEAED